MTSVLVARSPLSTMHHHATRAGLWLMITVVVLLCGGNAVLAQGSDEGGSMAVPQAPPATHVLTRQEQEAFLRSARILRSRPAPKGVTDSRRVTLSDGVVTHDAHVQAVDESRPEFRGRTYVELNFRDSWRFNVAAYRLSVLVGLDMVPVSVERNYQGRAAAFTWWVDDVAMDEGARLKAKVQPPDSGTWSQQMALVRMFDQLIYNTDRNLGNLLITSEWRLWMIDHTRAFRRHRTLRPGAAPRNCDGEVIRRLEALDKATLVRELSDYLEDDEIRALLVRRDRLVESFRAAGHAGKIDLAPQLAAMPRN